MRRTSNLMKKSLKIARIIGKTIHLRAMRAKNEPDWPRRWTWRSEATTNQQTCPRSGRASVASEGSGGPAEGCSGDSPLGAKPQLVSEANLGEHRGGEAPLRGAPPAVVSVANRPGGATNLLIERSEMGVRGRSPRNERSE